MDDRRNFVTLGIMMEAKEQSHDIQKDKQRKIQEAKQQESDEKCIEVSQNRFDDFS